MIPKTDLIKVVFHKIIFSNVTVILSFIFSLTATLLVLMYPTKYLILIVGVLFLYVIYCLITGKKSKLFKFIVNINAIYLFNLILCICLALFVDALIDEFTCYSVDGGPYSEEVRIPCSINKDLALRYIRVIYSYTPFPIYSEEGVARFWLLAILLVEAPAAFIYGLFRYFKYVKK